MSTFLLLMKGTAAILDRFDDGDHILNSRSSVAKVAQRVSSPVQAVM